MTGGGQVERETGEQAGRRRQANRQTEDGDRQSVDRDPASGLKTGNEKDTTMQPLPTAQELRESRGGRPGLPSLINLLFLWT